MKLAIIGSRGFNDYNLLKKEVNKLLIEFNIDTIISGGAKGADYLGMKFALDNNINYIEFPANWDKYGKSAGFKRNEDIIKNSDIVISFWDGKSKGTLHAMNLCKNKSLIKINYIDGCINKNIQYSFF